MSEPYQRQTNDINSTLDLFKTLGINLETGALFERQPAEPSDLQYMSLRSTLRIGQNFWTEIVLQRNCLGFGRLLAFIFVLDGGTNVLEQYVWVDRRLVSMYIWHELWHAIYCCMLR